MVEPDFLKRHLWSISVAVLSALLMAGVWAMANLELARVWQSYSDQRFDASANEAKTVAQHFKTIYQNTKRVAFFPSVQNIDRHATMLIADDKTQIQQIYNDLSLTDAVSKIDIVPASFNPKRIDPQTGQLEAPVYSFNLNIVEGGRYNSSVNPQESIQKAPLQPEIKTEEYVEIANHIAWLSKLNTIKFDRKGINAPMISGEEVLTSDNTIFNFTLNESDRRGIILSIPFYNYQGKFSGVVSTTILSSKLKEFLSQDGSFLVSPAEKYKSSPIAISEIDETTWQPSLLQMGGSQKVVRNIKIEAFDPRGKWQVGSQFMIQDFYDSAAFQAISRFASRALLLIFAVGSMTIAQIELSQLRVAKLRRKVNIDQLTKLVNRVGLETQLEKVTAEAIRGRGCTIFYLDLDKFKAVNDKYGHDAGDQVLRITAQRLQSCVRGYDTVARLGGDEFVILLPGLINIADIMALAKRMIYAVSQNILVENANVEVGVCIGITSVDKREIDPKDFIRQADVALNRAKATSGSSFRFYEPEMDNERERRKVVEKDITAALQNNQFEVYYQPIIGMKKNTVSCYEALIRWNHPVRGMVGPAEFIELAEQTGQINDIGQFVLKQACRDAIKLSNSARIAVNISAVQMRDPELASHVIRALAASGLPAQRLELEITETVIMKDSEGAFSLLKHLKNLGLRIALDDFGVGYSSLSYLTAFDFDKIKIDRSFVANVEGKKETAILQAIIGLSHSLGMTTTIEGVESTVQLERAKELGCDEIQGYYFSKPLPLAQLLAKKSTTGTPARSVA